jgi:hypothetical protein
LESAQLSPYFPAGVKRIEGEARCAATRRIRPAWRPGVIIAPVWGADGIPSFAVLLLVFEAFRRPANPFKTPWLWIFVAAIIFDKAEIYTNRNKHQKETTP